MTVTVTTLLLRINLKFLPVSKILSLLFIITLSAWGILIFQYWQMNNLPMSQMWMSPGSTWQWQLSDFAVVYTMWAVMMAAMMLPSAVPMIKALGAPCYLTKFRDSCRLHSFTYAATRGCPERPASATTTHKSRFVMATSNGLTAIRNAILASLACC